MSIPVRTGLHTIIMTSHQPPENGDWHPDLGNNYLLKPIAILAQYSKHLVLTGNLCPMIAPETASLFTHPN